MKRPKLTRRQLDGRPQGPIYRDVHPDRETMAICGPDGKVSIENDMPTTTMRAMRQQAKKLGVSPAELFVSILQDHMDKRERGF